MFVFSETHPLFEGLKLAPRILTEPHKVLAEQKAQQEVKVRPEGETVMTFETNSDGNLDEDIVDAVVKGTLAFKYRIKDNVWRIISKNDGVFNCPPDGWGDREYIPIVKQNTPQPSKFYSWRFSLQKEKIK